MNDNEYENTYTTKKSQENNIIQLLKRKEKKKIMLKSPFFTNNNEPPILNIPPVTKTLFLVTFGIFLIQYFAPFEWDYWLIRNLGFIPAQWSGQEIFTLWSALSPFTHLFLHGGWIHLLMNIFMLVAFGAGLEKMMGAKQMLIVYILSAIGGALTQFILDPHSIVSMIGASGAISGLFGAILLVLQKGGGLGPQANIKPFIFLWIGTSVIFGIMGAPGGIDNIAWAAHIGGFFVGLGYTHWLLRKFKP